MQKSKNYIFNYLLNELRPMFKIQYLREDIGAAIAVALVAIPLSLAVALATGVPPQVALISAVIGGVLGAIFGGSRLGVTGPAVAMSVLLAGVIQDFGFGGLLVIGVICGGLQIAFGVFKLGRIAKYIPIALVLAFAAGIGFLLFFEQLPYAFQIAGQNNNTITKTYSNWHLYLHHISSAGLGLTLLTVAILAIVPRFLPRAYAFLFAVLMIL